jgi:hypothetical protein
VSRIPTRRLSASVSARVRYLTEARAIEDAGGDWDITHAAAVLGVARSTFYKIPYIMRRAVHPMGKGKGRPVRIPPLVVRLWQSLNTDVALERVAPKRGKGK